MPNQEIIDQRQAEVDQYDQNIAMYTAILATLPTEWPARLEQFRGTKNEHEAAAKVDDLADVTLLSQLLYADACRAAIRAETVERTKAAAILAVLKAQA
jgi:flagellar motility protein MotE (MotC chaperone)